MKEDGVPDRASRTSGHDFTVNRRDFLGLVAASAATASLGLDALLEPGWLEVTNTKVAIPSIPSDHRGIRLALIADLHINDDLEKALRAARIVAEQRPDIAVLAGDHLEVAGRTDLLVPVLEELRSVPAVVGIHGNWEFWTGNCSPSLARTFADQGARLLVNDSWSIEVDDHPVMVYGIDDLFWGAGDIAGTLASSPTSGTSVMVCHEPLARDRLPPGNNVDIVLAGHSHGGQVNFPFIGPLWLPEGCGRYIGGLYPGDPPLYVTRGIGTSLLPVRFNCRPEVSFIELRSVAVP